MMSRSDDLKFQPRVFDELLSPNVSNVNQMIINTCSAVHSLMNLN